MCAGVLLSSVHDQGVSARSDIRLEPTGDRFELDEASFAHLRDGKAIEVWETADTANLLRSLGSSR